MSMVLIIAALLICCFLIFQIAGLVALFMEDTPPPKLSNLPFVSILVAARNEEENIKSCLEALNLVNYPTDLIEILVGNDCSTDATGKVVEEFAQFHSHVHVFHLDGSEYNSTKGKARVLAFLANKAKGEFLFITDADAQVNKEWVQELLSHFDEKTGIVSGMTLIKGKGLFSVLQSLDWMYYLSMNNVLTRLGMHITAVGNNMAVRKQAYKDTGGYEKIAYSITEDHKLYREVRKKGWDTKNVLTRNSLVYTKPIKKISTFMHQRKRWMKGARELPVLYLITLSFSSLFYPAAVILFFYNPTLFLFVWFLKYAFQTIHIVQVQNVLSLPPIRFYKHVFFEIYQFLYVPLMFLFLMLPIKTIWKERAL
jgi:1,2-diacylglycerol 3-beta-glucosyltransferase